jgi:hypothetical protein
VVAIFVITIAAAEIGVALAVVLLLFRSRATSDLAVVRELGEASPNYTEDPGGGPWPASTLSTESTESTMESGNGVQPQPETEPSESTP